MKLSRSVLAAALTAAAHPDRMRRQQRSHQTSSSPPTMPANAPAVEQAYISVVRQVLPSVVQITSDRSLGSSIVFDTKGNILTNAHVVGQATKFQVRLADSPKQSRPHWSAPTGPTTSPSSSSTSYRPRCTRRTLAIPPSCRSARSCWPWVIHSG
jgi:hypothetical protein